MLILQNYISSNEEDSEIKKYPLFLGDISEDFSANNMNKTGLNESLYDFFVDYRAFDTSNIIYMHKCLKNEHDLQ